MLGPSFSPSIARIPGPRSSHSRYQRRPPRRASCTRERSCERATSSPVSGGSATAASVEATDRLLGATAVLERLIDFDAHGAGKPTPDRVLTLAEDDEQRPAK